MSRLARALLLGTTLLCAPVPARADPLSSLFLTIKGAFIVGGPIAGIQMTWSLLTSSWLGQMGLSLLLNAAAGALARRKQQDLVRELALPEALPVYRFVYGETFAPATPAPLRSKGNFLYCCYLLNSRPSEGPFTLWMDKREVEVSGDPYDFSGPGAVATDAPFTGHFSYWIGRGEQVSPPAQILADAGDIYSATDGWRGRTVLWVKINAGAAKTRQERWPAAPPEVLVYGKWSKVWNPGDPGQDADDPSTWAWSANHGLCVLDALRCNPMRPYDMRNLWIETFAWAAQVADEPVAVKAGGTIPRYEVHGVLPFSEGSELEDQVMPLVNAGAARLVRVGGRLGILPGVYVPPVMTITDVVGQRMDFSRYRPSSELATEVSVRYSSRERFNEAASTPPYIIPGAEAEDGQRRPVQHDLFFVADHRQAQRVGKILGMRTRMQRSVQAILPPVALDLVAGSGVTLGLPAPWQRRNGDYEVEQIRPMPEITEDGMLIECPAALRETGPVVYAWDHTTDEQDVILPAFVGMRTGVQPPGPITVLSDASTVLVSGLSSIARIRFAFDPSPSATTVSYEWGYRQGSAPWQAGGLIDAEVRDDSDQVFGFLVPVEIGQFYTVRVSALAPGGASEWVESSPVEASAGSYLAPPPTPINAMGGAGQIAVTFRSPNSPEYRAMEIWGADTDSIGAASPLFGPIFGAANTDVTETEAGLGSAVTRYYFARSIDQNGERSPFSASISATTT